MSSKFQPDPEEGALKSILVDPEAFEASEQQFAASLEMSRPRFVIEATVGNAAETGETVAEESKFQPPIVDGMRETTEQAPLIPAGEQKTVESPIQPGEASPSLDPNAWRHEVAERLDRYRSKRSPKAPRYPSLRLKFESSEAAWTSAASVAPARELPVQTTTEIEPAAQVMPEPSPLPVEAHGRIIPFRRSAIAPPRPLEELADPVPQAPRILEAPDVAPTQPALGGILIEPPPEATVEKRPGIELPLQAAAMSRRLLAVATDAVLVLIAVALFAYVFSRTTAIIPPLKEAALMILALAALLWPAYQYTLLVYAGTTPGLRLAKLRLTRFDGSTVPKRLRRWRVLATALSGISLGLGYAWCILDEDQLCWHDRITRTYMAPRE